MLPPPCLSVVPLSGLPRPSPAFILVTNTVSASIGQYFLPVQPQRQQPTLRETHTFSQSSIFSRISGARITLKGRNPRICRWGSCSSMHQNDRSELSRFWQDWFVKADTCPPVRQLLSLDRLARRYTPHSQGAIEKVIKTNFHLPSSLGSLS
ncbi:hypothetical protein B0J12DRAFT_387933 [Macrophomina phaseolina]|uniref:Uncharacterized protein n=1 Tax=Macrophomina phaseolina TaxID=35725 RepID=A0ABQ8FSX1_9PEZI|nr:hypothetical protein B0J12DRAFT_387933 [Macrophomina phaseolina]